MYQLFISLCLIIIYLILRRLFPVFFKQATGRLNRQSFVSLLIIVSISFLIYLISFYLIADDWLSNRFLHFFGGGFLPFLVCFLVVKNTGLNIGKFQFCCFSLLVVIALGVGNEIIEFILQSVFKIMFTETLTDTWLDLTSNLAGACLAAVVFTPLLPIGEKPRLTEEIAGTK